MTTKEQTPLEEIRCAMDQDYKPTPRMVRVTLAEVDRLQAALTAANARAERLEKSLLNVLPKLEAQNRNGINWYHDICQINAALADDAKGGDVSERRSQAKEDLICDLQMNLKMARDCNKELQEELAAVTQERDELKADAVRFNIHLEQKDRAIAANAKYCNELKAANDELNAQLMKEAADVDHLRAEKLLILAQVTESDTLIRDALNLPPETEYRVEFYAGLIRAMVETIARQKKHIEDEDAWKEGRVWLHKEDFDKRLATERAQGREPFDFSPWAPPFSHECGSIFDSRGHKILDVRGWGFLTGQGSLKMEPDAAAAIQDKLGEYLARMLSNVPLHTCEQGAEVRKQVEKAERLEREAAQFRKWGNRVSATLMEREAAAIRRALPTQPKEAKDE